jgi:hypothetical protein
MHRSRSAPELEPTSSVESLPSLCTAGSPVWSDPLGHHTQSASSVSDANHSEVSVDQLTAAYGLLDLGNTLSASASNTNSTSPSATDLVVNRQPLHRITSADLLCGSVLSSSSSETESESVSEPESEPQQNARGRLATSQLTLDISLGVARAHRQVPVDIVTFFSGPNHCECPEGPVSFCQVLPQFGELRVYSRVDARWLLTTYYIGTPVPLEWISVL